MNIAIIFAGGSGVRMGAGVPKQFLEINGKPIIIHTLQLFEYHKEIDKIYVAVNEKYIDYMKGLAADFNISKVAGVVAGGETSQDSIYNALTLARKENPGDSIVLIHDGVRPYITYSVIHNNIESVKEHGNAITCTSCFETILLSKDGLVIDDVPYRKETFSAQAPQSFYLDEIIGAHEEIQKRPQRYDDMVDACTIYRTLGRKVYMVAGNRGNIKVTTPEDVYSFRALLQYKENEQAFGLGSTEEIIVKMASIAKKGD